MRPNRLIISRSALRHNFQLLCSLLAPGAGLCAVVKANGYGHGGVGVARELEAAGAPWLAVTSAEEGAELRQAGARGRILVLAGFTPQDAGLIWAQALTPTIWHAGQLEWLAAARPPAQAAPLKVHVKLDTGMARLGAEEEDEAAIALALAAHPELQLEAVFTHLAAAEAADDSSVKLQMSRFQPRLAAWQARFPGIFWHAANSAALFRWPEYHGGLVRAGLALYGFVPDGDDHAHPAWREKAAALRPAMSWRAGVLALRNLPAGATVGYGGSFRLDRPTRVATLAAGYGDGYLRRLGPGGAVLLGGRRCPILGAISMDLMTVDASQVPAARIGDEAVLLGHDGEEQISARELAGRAGTIVYEIFCGLSSRIPRNFKD